MKKPERKWRCGECGDVYDDEFDARDCCPPTVFEVWACPVCDESHDTEEEAETCCEADAADDQNPLRLPPQFVLGSLGQMRLLP